MKQQMDKAAMAADVSLKEHDPPAVGMQTIAKAIDILDVLSINPTGLSQVAIIEQVRLPKRTVQRILAGLLERGLVLHHLDRKRFYLNHSYPLCASMFFRSSSFAYITEFMARVYELFKTPLALYCQSGFDGFALERVGAAGYDKTYFTPEGLLVPLGALLPTFGVLAAIHPQESEKILVHNEKVILARNTHSLEFVREAVNRIRTFGFVHCQGVMFPHVSYVVFSLVLKRGCAGSLSVEVERKDKYTETIQQVAIHIQDNLSSVQSGDDVL